MCQAVLTLCQTHTLALYLKMYTFLALTIKTKVINQSISQLEHIKKVALVSSELENGCQNSVVHRLWQLKARDGLHHSAKHVVIGS
jgi:hypothetical protein